MIYVIGYRDKVPAGAEVVDTTSRSDSPFSPFLSKTLLPIKAANMENAWQYSKVYEGYDKDGKPTPEWFVWSQRGFNARWASRYPMGKETKPLYSWFKEKRLDYVEARKELYVPLYRNMLGVNKICIEAVNELTERAKVKDIALRDFDGYHTNDSFETILNNPNKKMGHAFVLREVILERLEAQKDCSQNA